MVLNDLKGMIVWKATAAAERVFDGENERS